MISLKVRCASVPVCDVSRHDLAETRSKSKKKPPTTSSPGDDVRRWRDGAAAPRDAEIARLGVERRVPVHVEDDDAIRRLEVQTRAAGLGGDVGEEDLRVGVESINVLLSLSSCRRAVYSNRVGIDGLERALQDVQRLCGSREDQDFCWG